MKHINIFYQVEGTHAQQHVEAPPDEMLGHLKQRIATKHGMSGELLLFVEDDDNAADENRTVSAIATDTGVKVNVHHCARIAVTVAFGGRTLERAFGPGTTIAHVKRWATSEFGMSEEDAGEHVLQIAGTHDRPTPSTHIGALVTHPHCRIAFDLVANERVQG